MFSLAAHRGVLEAREPREDAAPLRYAAMTPTWRQRSSNRRKRRPDLAVGGRRSAPTELESDPRCPCVFVGGSLRLRP